MATRTVVGLKLRRDAEDVHCGFCTGAWEAIRSDTLILTTKCNRSTQKVLVEAFNYHKQRGFLEKVPEIAATRQT